MSVSPKRAEVSEEETIVLMLAPFSPPPIVEFKDIKININVIRKILIRNPTEHVIEVIICGIFINITTNVLLFRILMMYLFDTEELIIINED